MTEAWGVQSALQNRGDNTYSRFDRQSGGGDDVKALIEERAEARRNRDYGKAALHIA